MTKLINILREILEASLANDADKSVRAKEYIKKINDIIYNYRSDNKEIKVKGISSFSFVEITFPDVIINFKPTNSGDTKAVFNPSRNGEKPTIEVYRCNIHLKPKLEVEYDDDKLYHELVHSLDFKDINTHPDKIGTSSSKDKKTGKVSPIGYKKYINHGLEMNAHFFQYFMPNIIKFIEKEKKIPDTFDEFYKEITKDPKSNEFIKDLRGSNKKKILKRLGTYYNDILKNPDFKIEKGGNVDDQQLKKATNGFVSKLKSILKIK